MPANILDGEKIAQQIYQEIRAEIQSLINKDLRVPGLATVLIGDNQASQLYVAKKSEACQKLGMKSKSFKLPSSVSEIELIDLIDKLNTDNEIDGILIQLPLPPHINTNLVIERINPKKDVDGFHPYNMGRLAIGAPLLQSCTPKGIMTLLSKYHVSNLSGMNAVIIGASNIVGKPMALELLNAKCTVTICHIHTKNISQHIKEADLVVSAAGIPHLIKGSWIKENAIVIDVGMNRLTNGQLIGDIEFEQAKQKASWITPVPKGVGPMTVATLMDNTLIASKNASQLSKIG